MCGGGGVVGVMEVFIDFAMGGEMGGVMGGAMGGGGGAQLLQPDNTLSQ